MEKILKNKLLIGVVIFYALLIYIGGAMTTGMNTYVNVKNETNINI
ncbi:MAG TPA: hypothetical protein PLV83_02150 [Bacilli bacterium]|nr:hypothetical protein [Bacilli bacterium]